MFRRLLKNSAPTWFASRLRRVIQVVCFLVFLVLFFYVACPYPARPARVWNGWTPIDVDLEARRIVVESIIPPVDPLPINGELHAFDTSASSPDYLGALRVVEVLEDQAVLEPTRDMSSAALDKLGLSFGPWSLGEQAPGTWPAHYAQRLEAKERLPAELLLALDPLVSVSTTIAARVWVWSLGFAGVMLLVCLVVPRGFCGYVCPLGTLIDLFDWVLCRRVSRLSGATPAWWRSVRYCVLLGVLVCSVCGVLISGFVAAIPVITRGLAFLLAPMQTAAFRGWYQVPPFGAGQALSVALLALVLLAGLIRPRLWCRYICPTGAVFSLTHKLRLFERRVDQACTGCGRCRAICPFDAIQDDYRTRVADCTLCRTCGGACPVGAIHYVPRWSTANENASPGSPQADSPGNRASGTCDHLPVTGMLRRRFLAGSVGAVAGMAGGVAAAVITKCAGAPWSDAAAWPPVRPPGSMPERQFLTLCIRCGECFRACPNDALQPLGFARGWEGLWTPHLVADWSGCDPSCCNCGQVCPTGAIRALTLDEKRVTRMGLAVVERATCLPHAQREACQLCVDECAVAGYNAIEFTRVGTEVDDAGLPVEGSGFLAPVVLAEKCVGCGLCQTRCRAINGVQKRLLRASAIRVRGITDGQCVSCRL
jgi:ferredoxin